MTGVFDDRDFPVAIEALCGNAAGATERISEGFSCWRDGFRGTRYAGPLFRRLLKTQPGASALIAFGFGIAWGEAVERNHRDLTLDRPSFYQKRTYGNRVRFLFREALA